MARDGFGLNDTPGFPSQLSLCRIRPQGAFSLTERDDQKSAGWGEACAPPNCTQI